MPIVFKVAGEFRLPPGPDGRHLAAGLVGNDRHRLHSLSYRARGPMAEEPVAIYGRHRRFLLRGLSHWEIYLPKKGMIRLARYSTVPSII